MTALVSHRPAVVVCRDTIAQHSKSFSLAARLLPVHCRDDAAVLYTWCRRADDAIDLSPTENQPRELARLRHELDSVYAGEAQNDVVLDAFQDIVNRYAIPQTYPYELLAGMEMDTHQTGYPDMHTLLHYCYRVASTVGLMMSHLIGLAGDSAMRNAAHMGLGMQLTNICRDVLEDWSLGRLYVPDSILGFHGIGNLRSKLGQPFPEDAIPAMSRAVDDLLVRADHHYRLGDVGLSALPWRAAFAVRSARLVYSSIGGRVRRQDCDIRAGRAYVPTWQKLLLVFRAGVTSFAEWPGRAAARMRRDHVPYATPTQHIEYPDDVFYP